MPNNGDAAGLMASLLPGQSPMKVFFLVAPRHPTFSSETTPPESSDRPFQLFMCHRRFQLYAVGRSTRMKTLLARSSIIFLQGRTI
jgi:hypothetical protein